MQYPSHLLKLIHLLKRFPGVGTKSAERFAFNLLTWPSEHTEELGRAIIAAKEELKECTNCGCLTDGNSCYFCNPAKRDPRTLCVIASPREAFAIELTHEYKGFYHVLGGVISPLERKTPEKLTLQKLKTRITELGTQEVVIALDSTLEGDATALFLKHELSAFPIQVSRLAFGLPMGSSLEYIDGGTLARAFSGRGQF